MPRRKFENFLDPGRDRFSHHLEIPELSVARRKFRRRVLLGCVDEQLSASRYRNEDDSRRKEHAQHHRVERDLRWPWPEYLSRRSKDSQRRLRGSQLFSM